MPVTASYEPSLAEFADKVLAAFSDRRRRCTALEHGNARPPAVSPVIGIAGTPRPKTSPRRLDLCIYSTKSKPIAFIRHTCGANSSSALG